MKKLKPISRVVVYDPLTKKLLLVRNKGTLFWYAPGGTWEWENENILECAKREVLEETGLHIEIKRLLYAQEFHGVEGDIEQVCLEMFWLGKLTHPQELEVNHLDLDPNGAVEEVRWFDMAELLTLKVFPGRLKDTFWNNIEAFEKEEDPFIGVS